MTPLSLGSQTLIIVYGVRFKGRYGRLIEMSKIFALQPKVSLKLCALHNNSSSIEELLKTPQVAGARHEDLIYSTYTKLTALLQGKFLLTVRDENTQLISETALMLKIALKISRYKTKAACRNTSFVLQLSVASWVSALEYMVFESFMRT